MPIYYQSDRVTLHHGDAAEVAAALASTSVDLVVTDPPYGVEWRSSYRAESFDQLLGDEATPDARAAIAGILEHCVRALRNSRHLYVFGPADVLEGLKVISPVPLVWDKGMPGLGDLTVPWGPAWEPVTFTVKAMGASESKGALAARLRKGSVLRVTRPTGRAVRHPSEKPTALLAEMIESSSRPGEVVLDPFAGIGSTGVAAVALGRRTILVEQDHRYVRIARDRLAAAERIRAELEAV